MDAAIIENNAMKLDEFQRALLADRLLDSIIPISKNLRQSWIKESENRLKAYQARIYPQLMGRRSLPSSVSVIGNDISLFIPGLKRVFRGCRLL